MLFESYRGTSKSTLFGTLRVCINSSFFGYFDVLEISTFKITSKLMNYSMEPMRKSLISKIIFRKFLLKFKIKTA